MRNQLQSAQQQPPFGRDGTNLAAIENRRNSEHSDRLTEEEKDDCPFEWEEPRPFEVQRSFAQEELQERPFEEEDERPVEVRRPFE